jgi:hypothetical protein
MFQRRIRGDDPGKVSQSNRPPGSQVKGYYVKVVTNRDIIISYFPIVKIIGILYPSVSPNKYHLAAG